ncbi:hypothetical protein D9M70_311670 [compost metagenome]
MGRVLELHHFDHAGHGLGLARIDSLRHTTETRRIGDHCHQHAGQLEILGEGGAAVGLVGAVLAGQALLADQREVLGRLEPHLVRQRLARRGLGQLAKAGLPAGRGMADHALAHADLRGRHLPLFGGGRHQHGAGAGTRLAHLLEGIGDGRAAAGALHRAEGEVVVERGVGRRALDAHLAPVGIQFLGQQGGQAGVGPLPHLHMLGEDGHAAIAGDTDEGVGCEGFGSSSQRFATPQQGSEGNAEGKAAAALEEGAPAEVENAAGRPGSGFEGAHVDSPQARLPAASWMAARIRT